MEKSERLHDLSTDLRTLRLNANKNRFSEGSRRRSTKAKERGKQTRRSSARYSSRLELQATHVYEKNCFMHTAIRNPITGQIRLEGVEDWLDFAFVDLWTRPTLSGTPDQLSNDRYMMKPKPLMYRSWVYHGLQAQEQQNELENKQDDPAILRALASPCIDSGISAGRWSSVMLLAPQVFPIVLVGNFLLMTVCLMTFLFNLFVAVHLNHHEWYRAQRLVTLPVRVIFLVVLFDSVSVPSLLNQGKIVNAMGYIIATVMSLLDIVTGDGVALLCRGLECKYEIIRELPNNVWVCKRKDGQPEGSGSTTQAKRDRVKIHSGICGVHNWDECLDLVLIADVHGLLVELVRPNKDEWMAFFGIYRRTGFNVKYMAQECFNVLKQTIEDVEDPTRRLKNRNLASTYLVPLPDGRLVTREEMDAGNIELEDYSESEDGSP